MTLTEKIHQEIPVKLFCKLCETDYADYQHKFTLVQLEKLRKWEMNYPVCTCGAELCEGEYGDFMIKKFL